MTEVRIVHALNLALHDALQDDPRVILMGEDIGRAGGAFNVTRGLLEKFPTRVLDTPISETAFTAAAVGAAMSGLRPVIEIMFMDFITLAIEPLVNQAAKARFMYGGQTQVPLVVRTPHGAGQSAGPQHSQCLEAWFAHVPGLVVVCPATVEDSYGLLRAAIDNPNPVVFVENKTLYGVKGSLTDPRPVVPIGKARVARSGSDLTIVTYGAMVHRALGAADALAQESVEAEVVDLRTLQPWDKAAVLESVKRTHRLVIAHEAVTAFGVGAEIAATIGSEAFYELDAPIVRVGAPFTPVPFAPTLERAYLPGVEDLVAAAHRVLGSTSP